ncbi:sulfatase-like hydrolase/transferase [Spongiactinospora gelatinilytica]|uniref:sulfatase-like hydrolase/transferase n=1 Tax=Spongiactinospora gelatinilytica TaxID=2666298 RepID=UPI002279B2EA|nr:sulfatase-like hydrolase/transferase [Spongiactinospora gelatinilytica]
MTARVKAGDQGALNHRDGGSLSTYRKMVQSLDSAVGSVLATLRSSGAERNTIVLFSSDNGGGRWSYQWPLSGGKGGRTEGRRTRAGRPRRTRPRPTGRPTHRLGGHRQDPPPLPHLTPATAVRGPVGSTVGGGCDPAFGRGRQ